MSGATWSRLTHRTLTISAAFMTNRGPQCYTTPLIGIDSHDY